MRFYEFKNIGTLIITSEGAKTLLKAREAHIKTLLLVYNLGLSKTIVELLSEGVYIDGQVLSYEELKWVLRDEDALYILKPPGKLRKATLFVEGKLYKLIKLAEDKAPTLEVAGIKIHNVKGRDPWSSANMKIEAAGISAGMKVLDVGTGLGYTSISSIMKGASEVWTIEKDVNVLRMAEINPWSKGLENPNIKKVVGDASKVSKKFESEEFDVIIHDPPPLSHAPEIYSLDFYQELLRLLKKGGHLNHYIGPSARSDRDLDILLLVSRRLKNVGFKLKVFKELAYIVAMKE